MRRLALPLAACLLLAGCAPTVTLTPAPDATAVGCARVIVGIREVGAVGAAERRSTDAQGTAAWGTPAAVTLYCGVETPQASGLRCDSYDGVDWLSEDRGDERVLTTFGRQPGVQVIVDTRAASASDALMALTDAVRMGTRSDGRRCLGASALSATP